MNDEVKLILTKLKIVSEEKENGAYICDKEHSKLLLSYIEQLEKELKEEQEDNYKQSEWLVKKQKKIEQLENNRDKAIEYNKNILKENWYGGYEKENAQKNINILKGDSDD